MNVDDPDNSPDDGLPDPDAPVNAADPRDIRRRARAVKVNENEAIAFWSRVFADPVGRREMWRLLQNAHPFEERFACGPNGFPQTEATWFHAGEQAFGLRLYHTWLANYPEGVMRMHAENDQRFQIKRT